MQISAAAAAAEAAPFFAVAFSPFDGEIVFLEESVRSANRGLRFEVRSYQLRRRAGYAPLVIYVRPTLSKVSQASNRRS